MRKRQIWGVALLPLQCSTCWVSFFSQDTQVVSKSICGLLASEVWIVTRNAAGPWVPQPSVHCLLRWLFEKPHVTAPELFGCPPEAFVELVSYSYKGLERLFWIWTIGLSLEPVCCPGPQCSIYQESAGLVTGWDPQLFVPSRLLPVLGALGVPV